MVFFSSHLGVPVRAAVFGSTARAFSTMVMRMRTWLLTVSRRKAAAWHTAWAISSWWHSQQAILELENTGKEDACWNYADKRNRGLMLVERAWEERGESWRGIQGPQYPRTALTSCTRLHCPHNYPGIWHEKYHYHKGKALTLICVYMPASLETFCV